MTFQSLGASVRCALLVAGVGATALAQTPQAPNITGKVVTAVGLPISGAEVKVGGTDASTRTDESGAFSFVNAPKGVQSLVVRRIGYLPTFLSVRVPESSDTVTVRMVPASAALDTVQVIASLNVLAGVVIDSSNRVVSDANVEIIGTRSGTATTDENGAFTFTSIRSGAVVLRVRKLGYEPTMFSVHLDDWRGVVLRLSRLDAALSASKRQDKSGFGPRSEWVWTETHDRLARRGVFATVVPREELAPFGNLSLGQAIRLSKSGHLASADLQPPGNDACVLIDGNRVVGSTSLDSFRADEVSFVELYPPGTETSGSVGRYLKGAGCRGLRVSASRNRGPYYAVVWLRT
jgi:carboxypeptidase family protein/carboxypeptidase-like protein